MLHILKYSISSVHVQTNVVVPRYGGMLWEGTAGFSTSKFTLKIVGQAKQRWLRFSEELYVVIFQEGLVDMQLLRSSTFTLKVDTLFLWNRFAVVCAIIVEIKGSRKGYKL